MNELDIIELFRLGMKREILPLRKSHGKCLNIGCGESKIEGTINIDYPEYDAEKMPLPFPDESIDTIFAFHFFEHLTGDTVVRTLRECERILKIGGTANIVVPHRLSQLAYVDVDHKTFFTEKTWKNIFTKSDNYYKKCGEKPWQMKIGTNIIVGINERNLALMTQLIKV